MRSGPKSHMEVRSFYAVPARSYWTLCMTIYTFCHSCCVTSLRSHGAALAACAEPHLMAIQRSWMLGEQESVRHLSASGRVTPHVASICWEYVEPGPIKLRAFILEAIPGLSASQLLNAASPRDVSPSDRGGGERAALRRFQRVGGEQDLPASQRSVRTTTSPMRHSGWTTVALRTCSALSSAGRLVDASSRPTWSTGAVEHASG